MMGGCFDKMSNPNDMNISKSLKEEARDIFTQNLSGQNYTLEASIYKALIELYNEIANQQEQMKNYTKAIDLLYKLLEVLDCLNSISDNLKEGGMGQKENEDKKTETYLKISNLYYRINDYEHTIETLAKIANIKSDSGDSTLTVRNYYIIYIYLALSNSRIISLRSNI
jgi:tetratricopeptide (TPR) repeat protein